MYNNNHKVELPDYVFDWYFKNHKPLRIYLKKRQEDVNDVNSIIIQLYIVHQIEP